MRGSLAKLALDKNPSGFTSKWVLFQVTSLVMRFRLKAEFY